MLKKALGVTLAVMFLFAIAGCGQSTPSSTPQATEIKIGFYTPLSGPTSLIGIPMKEGVDLAVKQINEGGGVNGKKIKLIAYDDKASAEDAVKSVTRLVQEDKVTAIVGSLVSGNIMASASIIEKNKIPEVGCGTSPIWTNQGFQYIFRGTVSSGVFNVSLVKAMKQMNVKKLAILSSSTEYAKVGSENLLNLIKQDGTIEVIAHEHFQGGDTDFTGQMTKMISTKPDAMFLYASAEDMGMQMKQFRQLGWSGNVFGPEGFNTPDVVKVAGKAADGAVFSCGYVIPVAPEGGANDAEKKFLVAYVKEYGHMPVNDTAYRGFDSMMILATAMKNANSLDGTAIRDAIRNITDYKGIAGTFNFKDGKGDGIASGQLFTIQNGKFMPLENFLNSKK